MSSIDDKIRGAANNAVGNAKQVVGDVNDDEKLQAEGKAQEVKGDAQTALGNAKEAVGNAIENLGNTIKNAGS